MIFKYEIGDKVAKAADPVKGWRYGIVLMLGFDGQRAYLVDFDGSRMWWREDLIEPYEDKIS